MALLFRSVLFSFLLTFIISVLFNSASAQGELQFQPQIIPNELLIKLNGDVKDRFKEDVSDTGIVSLNEKFKTYKIKSINKIIGGKNSDTNEDIFRWYKITLENGTEQQELMDKLLADENIEAVEPNQIAHGTATPNDTHYPLLWGMQKINMETAWNESTGSPEVVVANIDSGADYNHEDLKDNMWVNINDPIDGVDNDGNGFLDDYLGWDFVNSDNDPMDDNGHGTHTAGTIGAVGNNGKGVTGVNWTTKIMAVKFLDRDNRGTFENAVKAITYATNMGARVASHSWIGGLSAIVDDALKNAHGRGVTTVVAAGNDTDDALKYSPASSDHAITVSASDTIDFRATFSNWGEKIDVSAPGVDILSTRSSQDRICSGSVVGNFYCRISGTSMSTPHVSGLAALMLSKNPALTNEEIRQILRREAKDAFPPGKDRDHGYGRIDAAKTMAFLGYRPIAPFISSPSSRSTISGTVQIIGSLSGAVENYKIEAGLGRSPTSWTLFESSNNGGEVLGSFDTTSLIDGLYILRLTAKDPHGKTYQFQVHDITVDNPDFSVNIPLESGWNSIAIPVNVNLTPQDLIVRTGNSCTVIISFDPSDGILSQSYSLNPIPLLPNTLNKIKPLSGYFIYCNNPANISFLGSAPNSIPTLYQGSQLISVPFSKNNILAEAFLQEVVTREPNLSCPSVTKYNQTTGEWDITHLLGSVENNFPLSSTAGYMVWCEPG